MVRYSKNGLVYPSPSDLKKYTFYISFTRSWTNGVTAVNILAQSEGIDIGLTVADARAIITSLQVLDDKPELTGKLLNGIAEWCIRYSPAVAVDQPDGLILNITGCSHLWGGEKQYLTEINKRLQLLGYAARIAVADTIGTAWAIARFGKNVPIVESSQQAAKCKRSTGFK